MPGLSTKLPLIRDPIDGFALTQTYHELAKQNFKMLILTNPGERMMDPSFGVGIRNFLFEPNMPEIQELIETRIIQQTARYLPYIDVLYVEFDFAPKAKEHTSSNNIILILFTITSFFILSSKIKIDLRFFLVFVLNN